MKDADTTGTRSHCVMGDAGLAVCLLSAPFQRELQFFSTEIDGAVFQKYREAVRRNFSGTTLESDASEFASAFYRPAPYYLFGRFDLAILTLVDDFEFSSRTFHPFDPMMADGPKDYFENFLHKVITGPTPTFDDKSTLIDLARRTFLAPVRKPLFGLSLFKLNNSLLVGTGTTLLRTAVTHARRLASAYRP